MFGSLKTWLIIRLGGYTDVDDCIDYIKSIDDQKERHKVLTAAVKRLYNTVGKDDILKVVRNGIAEQWWFEGKLLTAEEVRLLKHEAEAFKASRLYRVLDMECRYQANKRMHEAATLPQLESAKLFFWVWDLIKTRLKEM